MKQPDTIRKFTAALLLLIFSFSIAPKTFFHDLVADHKDQSGCKQLHHGSVLHQQAMHCHFDDLVVTAPFAVITSEGFAAPFFHFDKADHSHYNASCQDPFLRSESRGPPAA